MHDYFAALKTPEGNLIPLADSARFVSWAQYDAMHAMALEHLAGVPLRTDAALVVVRVADNKVIRLYNRETTQWESVVHND
jgi:hypothetical protein